MAWKEVPRGEFELFLASYGEPLVKVPDAEGTTMCDPSLDPSGVARTDGAKFFLWTDEPPDDLEAREAMIRSGAFGDVSGMGRRG